jgi:hypothetical protein
MIKHKRADEIKKSNLSKVAFVRNVARTEREKRKEETRRKQEKK